jgi:hypothetical protein
MATVDHRGMRSLRSLAVLLVLVPAGCLELEQTVTLAPNGSGTQVVRMTIGDATLTEVQRASPATEASGAQAAKAVFDKDLVARELGAAGLVLDTHRVARQGTRRTVEVGASFASFAILQQSPLAGTRAEWALTAGPKPGTAKLTLYPQGKAAWTEARAKADAMAGATDEVAEAFFRKRQQELTGLDLTVRFQLPGDVLVWTANMEKTGPREVTARVTAAQIKTPQDLVRRLAPRFEAIFDATGCSLPLE